LDEGLVRRKSKARAGQPPGRKRLVEEALALISRFATVALLGIAFFLLGDTVVEDGRQRLDVRLALAVHNHLGSVWTRPMLWATTAASAQVVVPLMLALCGWLAFRRRRYDAGLIAAAWIGGQILHVSLKLVYQRPRPSLFPPLSHASGYSFPSGHTVTAVMTYGLIAAVIGPMLPRALRWAPIAIASVMVALVGLSRVYLGVLYPTDVLGSVLIAGAWLRVALLSTDHLKRRRTLRQELESIPVKPETLRP